MKWNFKGNGDETSPKKTKNIYARGADDGFWLGLYFSVLFGVTVVSLSLPLLNIIAVAMALGVPFLTYFFLRRTHVAAHGMTLFSALWMQGITMFACGCLIFGAVSFTYLRWIDPEFLVRVLRMGGGILQRVRCGRRADACLGIPNDYRQQSVASGIRRGFRLDVARHVQRLHTFNVHSRDCQTP